MEIEGTQWRGCPKKIWWEYIRGDVERSFGLSSEDAQDRVQWRLGIEGVQLTWVYLCF